MKKSLNLTIDTTTGTIEYGSGRSIPGTLKQYNSIVQRNTKMPWNGGKNAEEKGKIALEAGQFFRKDIEPLMEDLEGMRPEDICRAIGLEAADYSDPNNQFAILNGTMVLQRTLPLFAYEYPELGMMFTDFSAEPGLFEQAEDTRIVSVPAVQKYDGTLDASNRPKGFVTVSAAKTTDVPITLTDYIGVPIVIGQATLSATGRDLFGEQVAAGMRAIGGYFVGLVVKLLTPANFNAYVNVTAPDANGFVYVPTAYTTYARSLTDWSMTDLDKLSAIFTQNQVPRDNRGILMNTQRYAKLRSDPRLSFFFAAAQGNPQLTQQKLPDGLSGFFPYEAPYLPTSLEFFPFHQAGIILKARLPRDFTSALAGTLIPGSVTTVTDPKRKLSVALVQRVDLTGNYAEWRPEVMLGAGLGDVRGGLCGAAQ